MDIHGSGIALIHAQQHLTRKLVVGVDALHSHAVEGRQISNFSGCWIYGMKVPVFVSRLILDVEDVLAILGPKILADSPPAVASNHAIVGFVLSHGTQPYVEDTLVGSEIAHQFAVGRELRRGFYRIAKDHSTRNERGGHPFHHIAGKRAKAYDCMHDKLF